MEKTKNNIRLVKLQEKKFFANKKKFQLAIFKKCLPNLSNNFDN